MEIRHVKSFYHLARELHFGRTAALLNLSPPALSQHIKGLEKDLHVQLFIRDRRTVELTDAGIAFLPHAKILLSTIDAAMEDMGSRAQGMSGILRVGLFVNNVAELTVPILQRFRSTFPNVQINFVPIGFGGQINTLVNQNVDVAFVRPPIHHESIHVHVLGYEPRVAVVSKQNDLAEASSITVDELSSRRFINASAIPAPSEWTSFWLLLEERNESLPQRSSDTNLIDFDAVSMDIAINDTITTVPASVMREAGDRPIRGVKVEGLKCALAVAAHVNPTPLTSHFLNIAEETAKDLLTLVPDASYSLT